MTNTLLLSAFLLTMPAKGSDYQRAGRYLGKALYKEYRVDEYARRLERQVIDEDTRKSLTPVVTVGRIIVEQRVELEWRF